MSNFKMAAQILTGAQRRRAKANNDIRAFTRAQAVSKIADMNNPEETALFTAHPNKHVQAYAERKTQELRAAMALKAKRSAAAKKAAETRKKNREAQASPAVA